MLKAPGKICSRRQSKIFIFYFSEKTSLDISYESSAWQTIHMKCQDLFSSENKKKKKKKSKLSSALVVIGALRVKKKFRMLSAAVVTVDLQFKLLFQISLDVQRFK